jgi:RNA polymerase sigma-70 factor (sigma-E family)
MPANARVVGASGGQSNSALTWPGGSSGYLGRPATIQKHGGVFGGGGSQPLKEAPMTEHTIVAEAMGSPITGPYSVRQACVVSLADEFDSFVYARTPALLRAAYLLTGDQHLAEDLVQTALARTHRAWKRLHATGNAEAYTRKVMYHLQVSWWRRGRVAESISAEVPEPRRQVRQEDTNAITVRITLRQALRKLTARQRAVLVLRFYEDRTEAESAELLGVSIGTVKSQTAKALARLRTVAPELTEIYSPKRCAR